MGCTRLEQNECLPVPFDDREWHPRVLERLVKSCAPVFDMSCTKEQRICTGRHYVVRGIVFGIEQFSSLRHTTMGLT